MTRRPDPSVLLLAVVLLPVLLVPVREPAPVAVLWAVLVTAALTVARVPPRALVRSQVPFAGFATSLVLVNAVTRDGQVLLRWGALEVTDVGLRTGGALALRTLVVGVAATAFLHLVDPAALLSSLHVVARLPVRLTTALAVAHRVLEDLPGEWLTIRQVQALRGPVRSTSAVGRPVRGRRGRRGTVRLPAAPTDLAQAAFALLVRCLRRAEQSAVALESRALGALPGDQRTVRRQARVTRLDALVLGGVVVACGLTVLASA